MKYYYTFILLFAVTIANAQMHDFSFEASEGFILGSIHNQNGWEVTEGSDGVLENQIITDEKASHGLWSFKNAYEPDYGGQWMPIFGAAFELDSPLEGNYFQVFFDVLITESMGSDFEMTAWTVENNEYFPIAGVKFSADGKIHALKDKFYTYEELDLEWEPNTWINVRIVRVIDWDVGVYYLIDNEEVYSVYPPHLGRFYGYNMLHDNLGGDAFYDNLKLDWAWVGVEDFVKEDVAVYPNPTQDKVNISYQGLSDFQEILVYDAQGRLVGDFTNQEINLEHVEAGIYHIQATTKDGYKINRKLVKH